MGMSKSKESGAIISQLWSAQMDRKRGRPLGSKSKRLRLDSIDSMLLKSNWEEVQELLRPAPSATPTVITIDGHEFEEYSVITEFHHLKIFVYLFFSKQLSIRVVVLRSEIFELNSVSHLSRV